ncbi:MAG: TIGR00300 family protein [Verrucomicrobia bacterium]|nr:TIGR00300 family protein [Verrucomicrobiota bacterium]MBV9644701.1 TIGR00300 family protein [Verrucomicrobiota bacterium]
MGSLERYLMCPPEFFQVDYVINPWMEGNIDRANGALAAEQWHHLHLILAGQGKIELISPLAGSPDMVFTANAGLVLGDLAVLSRFMHQERQSEEPHFREWFQQHGFRVHELPKDLPFEGAGDAILERVRPLLWAGYGFRTELDTHALLAELLSVEVVSLRLIDKRFYHLDTCFCPLERGFLIYYPPAFDARSNAQIEHRFPTEKRIVLDETDAVHFAANAVNIGETLVLHRASDALKIQLSAAGFQVFEAPLTEFIKSGGAARCLTLRLNELPKPGARAHSEISSRVLRLEGHLLDSGLLDRALELTVQNGGSFQILNFQLGKQRQSTSKSDIRVSAPAADVLGNLVSQLIELGCIPAAAERKMDVQLETVTIDGVAPDDFYVTTIYPTQVRLKGKWTRITGQRMDGCIVVDESDPGQPTATVRLMRDLRLGDRVVVGIDGIRTVRKSESREERGIGGAPAAEFAFMGAGVSSERKIELVVREIAWELERIRERGGKVVVVAGPVVIHTGASEHLAALIRAGFVQVVLGGNGMAVHDIEQSILGTSLGVDMSRGTPVHGGHRHHLRAINTIRRCGSIAAAVEQGVLRSGILYECVCAGVPFSLAASIRDDGPLPGVFTDMIEAQRDYARLIAGADMILMLSSMLHSIGVGNMTPAGVKLVCVDINPAVVTKLADRGSIESIGVVTDVGLFLSLLVQQVRAERPSAAEELKISR